MSELQRYINTNRLVSLPFTYRSM